MVIFSDTYDRQPLETLTGGYIQIGKSFDLSIVKLRYALSKTSNKMLLAIGL